MCKLTMNIYNYLLQGVLNELKQKTPKTKMEIEVQDSIMNRRYRIANIGPSIAAKQLH